MTWLPSINNAFIIIIINALLPFDNQEVGQDKHSFVINVIPDPLIGYFRLDIDL